MDRTSELNYLISIESREAAMNSSRLAAQTAVTFESRRGEVPRVEEAKSQQKKERRKSHHISGLVVREQNVHAEMAEIVENIEQSEQHKEEPHPLISVDFDRPLAVFLPGQIVSGVITIHLTEPERFKGSLAVVVVVMQSCADGGERTSKPNN